MQHYSLIIQRLSQIYFTPKINVNRVSSFKFWDACRFCCHTIPNKCVLLMKILPSCYRPQMKFAKVMFLHLYVILFTGGMSRPTPRGRLGGLAGGPTPGGGPRPRPIGGVSQHALRQTLTPSIWLLLRTVRILLECILVFYEVCVFYWITDFWTHLLQCKLTLIDEKKQWICFLRDFTNIVNSVLKMQL